MSAIHVRVTCKEPAIHVPLEFEHRDLRLRHFVLQAVLPVAAGVLALFSEAAALQLAMASFAVGLTLLFLFMNCWATLPTPGTIRFAGSTPMRFVPDWKIWIYSFGGAGFLLLAGLIIEFSGMLPGLEPLQGAVGRRGSGIVIIALAIFPLVSQTIRFVRPHGVELQPTGLTWFHGRHNRVLAWEEISEISLQVGKRKRRIVLESHDGETYSLAPIYFGSDPIIVSNIIDYFRRNPKERHKLNDPQAALNLVTEPIEEPL